MEAINTRFTVHSVNLNSRENALALCGAAWPYLQGFIGQTDSEGEPKIPPIDIETILVWNEELGQFETASRISQEEAVNAPI